MFDPVRDRGGKSIRAVHTVLCGRMDHPGVVEYNIASFIISNEPSKLAFPMHCAEVFRVLGDEAPWAPKLSF